MFGKPEITKYWVKCEECGKKFQKLQSHLYYKHKMSVPEYKEKWGLDINQPLECRLIHNIRSQKTKENGTIKYILNVDNGHRFKKGDSGKQIFREQSRIRVSKLGKQRREITPQFIEKQKILSSKRERIQGRFT